MGGEVSLQINYAFYTKSILSVLTEKRTSFEEPSICQIWSAMSLEDWNLIQVLGSERINCIGMDPKCRQAEDLVSFSRQHWAMDYLECADRCERHKYWLLLTSSSDTRDFSIYYASDQGVCKTCAVEYVLWHASYPRRDFSGVFRQNSAAHVTSLPILVPRRSLAFLSWCRLSILFLWHRWIPLSLSFSYPRNTTAYFLVMIRWRHSNVRNACPFTEGDCRAGNNRKCVSRSDRASMESSRYSFLR